MNTTTQMRQNMVRIVLLCMVMLCGGGTAWGDKVVEVYDMTSSGTPDITLNNDKAYQQTGTNAKTVYELVSTPTLNLNGRVAINNTNKTNDLLRWMWRSSANAYQNGLAGYWYGSGAATASFNISIIGLQSGESVTISYSVQAGKGADLHVCSSGVLDGLNAEAIMVSGTEYTMQKNGNLDLYCTNNNMAIQTITIKTNKDEPVYIKNVESRKFLGGANSWGTQASLTDAGAPYDLESAGADAYDLKNTLITANNKYLGSNLYTDGTKPAGGWTFTEHDNGYWISNAGNYLGYSNDLGTTGDNLIATTKTPDARSLWKKLTRSEAIEEMSHAKPSAVEYATFLMSNPNFNRNTSTAGWKVSNDCTNKNLAGGGNNNYCAESYHSPFTISQTLTGVPNGIYKMTAQGFYRQDGTDILNMPYFFANDEERIFPLKTGSESSMANASTSFSSGLYTIDPIIVEVKNGTLEVGVKNANAMLWCIWDNFRITYYGNYSLPTPVMENETLPATLNFEDIPDGATISYRIGDTGDYTNYTPGNSIESNSTVTVNYRITYADGEVLDGIKTDIIVREEPVFEVPSSVIVPKDETQKLDITTNSDGALLFEDYDTSIISVDNMGNITALDFGETDVTVNLNPTDYYSAKQATVHVVVPSEGTGAVDYLADIDFSNDINDGVIAGTVNSMAVSNTDGPFENPPFEIGFNGANTDVLRVGNGTGTVAVDKSKIGERDAVKVTFDMYFGSLNGKSAGIDLLDEEGNRIAGFYYSKYSGAIAGTYDDFGMDWGKISSVGSSSASNAAIYAETNKTTFTITLDYMFGTMSIVAENGQYGRQERSVPMTNFNLMKSFVAKSDYNNADRRCWFDNLKVKVIKGDYTVEPANYTVRYLNEADQTPVKEAVVRKSLPNRIVTLGTTDTDDFKNAGNTKKYIYVSDNASEVRIAEDGSSVITVLFREAAEYTWRLTTTVNTDTELPSGTSFEGDIMTVSYPAFIVDKQGNLYSTTQLLDDGKQYAVSFTPDHNDFEQPLEYTATGDKNVVFLSEAEDVEGLVMTNEGGCAVRTSGGRAAYAAEATTLVKGLPRGSYVLTGFVFNNSNNTIHEMFVNVGDINIWSLRTNTNGLANATSEPFGIKDENTEITIPVCGGTNVAFDLFYIRRVGEFTGDPVITKNLKSSYKVEREQKIPIAIQAENAPWFKWYKWTADPTTFDPETLNITDANATLLEASKSNSYTYIGASNGKEYIFAEVVGYGSSIYTRLAEVETIDPLGGEGAVTLIFAQDYNNAAVTDWIGSGNNSTGTKDGDKCTMISNNQSGPRASYIQLSSKFDNAPSLQNGTWILDYDFSPGAVGTRDGNIQGFAVYNKALGMPTFNTNYAPDAINVFFGLDTKEANSNVYIPYLGGAAQTENEVELVPGDWYHVHLEVTNSSIEVQLTNGKGRAVVYEGNSSQALTTGMDLGGIHQFIPREGGAAYYDNIELKIKTNQPIIASDLPEFSEVNDDSYLNEGEGLDFDVPAATEFNWYVSSVAPSKDADGITAPQLMDDGSVKWTNGRAFMTVTSPVDRASTTITKTNGVELSTSGKHAVTPTESNDGKYAWGLQQTYGNVQTVWDEATVDNSTSNIIYRYYPEATASGSRWHYLRQLDINAAEHEHTDYVWCVASNALGDVTSKVAQIEVYPEAPLIYLLEDYLHEDADGDRYDMTLPANYRFRDTYVKINANNLIFNTLKNPVPHTSVSTIQYIDKDSKVYTTSDYPFDPATSVWANSGTPWGGVYSTTVFTGLDLLLDANSSVHGYYKSFGMAETGVQIDFTYGLKQMLDPEHFPYHPITKVGDEHGGVQYIIGVSDNSSLQATQSMWYDYGRYPATPFTSVSEKTTWDWSKLPPRSFLTYNTFKYTTAEQRQRYLHEIGGTTYVVDPETGLGGPEMGKEYLLADFYGYKPGELNGFPSDKVMLGIEYINEPDDLCMQGNAFIFKPTEEGTLTVTFSSTDGNQTRYLELCTRDAVDGADTQVAPYAGTTSSGNADFERKTLTMDITTAMKDKYVVIRARNVAGQPDNTGTGNQFFRIYSATYTPTTKPVTFTEWKVKDRNVGEADVYATLEGDEKSDGYVSLATTTPGAIIKYKIIDGTDKTDEQLNDIAAHIDDLNAEELVYKGDTYSDSEGNKVGIHCRVNSTIFAWAESDDMNRSEVAWLRTNAAVYPVDMRFMEDFNTSSITSQDQFDTEYWGTSQSSLSGMTMEELIALSTNDAPKAWNATKYGTATIDGMPYTEANFSTLYITHGTVIDIYVNPTQEYTFTGWGAPSWGDSGVVDMMRSGAKAKFVHYHLLYDKAKAKTTAGIAFLVANFTRRTAPLTAHLYVKEEDDGNHDDYQIPMNVSNDDKIVAPTYHAAYNLAGGHSVTHWTDDYRPSDADAVYEDYLPGTPKQIYQNTIIKPVMRENTFLDNYLGRTNPLDATWWFTTDHNAQNLIVRNEYAGFSMPYVTPVKRSLIGTVPARITDYGEERDNPEDITFDLPLTITIGTTGRLDNTVTPDWCAVGRGTTFTVPVCSGTDVSMEVRSPLSSAAGGTTFAGEYPTLWKVKYKDEAEYAVTSTPDPAKTVEAYIYKYTYTGDGETLDIILGNDYSYIRNIGVSMPVVTSNRDAALITLDFSQLGQHLDIASAMGLDNFSPKPAPKPYGNGYTGDGYEFDHKSTAKSLYRTHYSKEDGAIYYDGVSGFMVGEEVPADVPYVNGVSGYTYSTQEGGTFIIGPFRSITHIRYKQGSSRLSGGGWIMKVGRKTFDGMFDWIQTKETGNINEDSDTRRNFSVASFNDVQWSEPKAGSISNSRTPVWVEMDIEEHIYPNGKDMDDVSLIETEGYDQMQGDIWLKFEANNPDVYLFSIEIYGIDPTSDQQVTLETGLLAADNDDDTDLEASLRAGSIYHYPYLLKLDEEYKPVTGIVGSNNKLMQFNAGREVSFTATPNTGYDFQKWVKPDGNGGWEDVSTANPYVFNIMDDTQLRAVFVHRGIINYTTDRINYGLVPDQQQTDGRGGFTVAENRGMYAGDGKSLRQWQDAMTTHEWYTSHPTISNSFRVSTNVVGETTASSVAQSRAEEGGVVDVYPQFSANTLELLDVVGRTGATARWLFGKKNGALTMEGAGTTPRMVTQVEITGNIDEVDGSGNITQKTISDVIDVSMEMQANVNNAGRADEYATVTPGNRFKLPATRGMQIAIAAQTAVEYSINDGEFQPFTAAFKYYGYEPQITLSLRNAADHDAPIELEYIQATYRQRAQKPVLSMQKVDVWDDDPSDGVSPTNNVQVDVQTSANPTAVRFYTLDGSDPQYEATAEGIIPKPGTDTRLVRGNYITINESQIQTGTQLKVLSVCPDRADSKLSTLDLEPYDPSLALATYIHDSRVISIHNDQIFQKLLRDHTGHFNLMSYDLNPNAAKIPELITDHTTVFITSDAVRNNAMDALTNPSNPSSQGQKFLAHPLILGTPLTILWNAGYDNEGHINGTVNDMTDPSTGGWLGMTWTRESAPNPATPTSPATITYTEFLSSMKNQKPSSGGDKTYAEIYATEIAEAGGKYVLAFFDNMLVQHDETSGTDKVVISNTTSLEPQYLNANGTQLVFNATELLTRKHADGTFADVSSYASTVQTLMAPTMNPQLTDVKMTYTQEVTDMNNPGDALLMPLDATQLAALADGVSEMSQSYLAASYPQFYAQTISGLGQVAVTNVQTVLPGDDLATAPKLGAQGVRDLATIFTVTHPAANGDDGDPDFKRTYRVEYNIATEDITFRKGSNDTWVCSDNELWTLVEAPDATGQPTYKLQGPQNYGIKNVSFNGYAVAPAANFDTNGEIKPGTNSDGTPMYGIWGRGEKFNSNDDFTSPTAYNVTSPLIPEYPNETDCMPLGQWMTSEFPWGFKDCNQMAFTLLNINKYVGDIKVTIYRRQAESPKLLSAVVKYKDTQFAIADNMVLEEPNGEFVLEFNSVMHEVRKPGTYDSATGQETVTWTVHIIPEENYPYDRNNPTDFTGVDANDIPGKRIELYSEGGTNTLRFQYWNLTPGKKYYLHLPFQVLRGAVGTGVPYHLPENLNNGYDGPEEHMSWTDYPDVPYFDIPFTVKVPDYVHQKFNYIVSNDDWWDVLKEDPGSSKHGEYPTAGSLPSYATWDGSFTKGVNQVQGYTGSEHYYMHVQKKVDASGNPVAYTYDSGNGLMGFDRGNFSITGEGQDSTIITAEPEAYADSDYRGLREDMVGNQTATIHLDASNVYMQDLTIRNTQKGLNQDGQKYPALFDHGERNVFYGVNIDGYEESFAVFGSLSYLKNSRVSGFGDFIVGSGDVWLDSCDIVLRNSELINLCKPSTKATNKWGLIFNGCNITREAGATQVLDHNWTLARPWDGYDDIPKSPAVTFLNTKMEVLPVNSGYGTFSENLPLRFHEYGTMTLDGTAISLSTRSISNCTPAPESDAPVLTPQEAEQYSVMNVFGHDNGGYDPEALARQAVAPHLDNNGMVLQWNANPSDLCYLVYYLGDGEEPDYQHAQMFCCVPGTDAAQAYCYLTNHDISPIFRTGETDTPISFSEMWYGRRKSDPYGPDYDGERIDGMGKASPSRLWFTVRAANQMGGLSEMSNAIMYHAAHQYRTTITQGGVKQGDETGNAYSTLYLDFKALAPTGVRAYALYDVSSDGEGTEATTLTFTRVNDGSALQDVLLPDQGYLIYGPYGKDEGLTSKEHTFIETTADPTVNTTSYLSGTVGLFLNKVSETGLGETDEQASNGHGWSVNPLDYQNVILANTTAFTLQKYNNTLGFYKYSSTTFLHHRAYLDTDDATRVLMEKGMTKQDADRQLARGMRLIIRERDGSETDITPILMDEAEQHGVYDLMGRRIQPSAMLPGHIYIVDGKKVMR